MISKIRQNFRRWLDPSKKLLTDFVEQTKNQTSFIEEGYNNLENRMVEFFDKDSDKHLSNGFLLTANGYIITCYHCIEKNLSYMALRLDGQVYDNFKICAFSKNYDLALIKVKSRFKKELKSFWREAESGLPIAALRYDNGKVIKETGFISRDYKIKKAKIVQSGDSQSQRYCYEQIKFFLRGKKGFSGGPIIDCRGNLIAILTSIDEVHCTMATPWIKISELIEYYLRNKKFF